MIKKYSQTLNKFHSLGKSTEKEIGKLAQDQFASGVSVSSITDFMVEASKNEEWTAEFSKALKLGDKLEIKSYSEEEVAAQVEILYSDSSKEEKDKAVTTYMSSQKDFATTGSDKSGSNISIDGILPTNIMDVSEFLLRNDGGILSQFTIETYEGESQMPEFDVQPTTSLVSENSATVETNYTRRDGDDYKLNPNIKLQALTKITELGLRKGSPTYFAKLYKALIRSVSNEIARQAFQGQDTLNQFHGMWQTVTPANARNKRGAFNLTTQAQIAAEPKNMKKLILMLGQLPSTISDTEVAGYTWNMNRTTFFNRVLNSVDGFDRYYIDTLMRDMPTLVGPGGLKVNLVSNNCLSDGQVVLGPLNEYILALPNGVQLKDDGGIVNFNAGETLVKAYTFADGGYTGNFMSTVGGNTADDNQELNMWRTITLS